MPLISITNAFPFPPNSTTKHFHSHLNTYPLETPVSLRIDHTALAIVQITHSHPLIAAIKEHFLWQLNWECDQVFRCHRLLPANLLLRYYQCVWNVSAICRTFSPQYLGPSGIIHSQKCDSDLPYWIQEGFYFWGSSSRPNVWHAVIPLLYILKKNDGHVRHDRHTMFSL